MTFDELIDAVEEAAAALTMVAPDVTSGKGKAFEAWALLAIARHLGDAGRQVDAVGCDGMPVSVFVVRGGPGGMPKSTDDPAIAPSHLVIEGPEFDDSRELHLGLRHGTEHGTTHELDLSAISAWAGEKCRDAGGGPFRGRILLAAELKAYDAEHKLSLVFGRALLGVMVDLQPWRTVRGIYVDIGHLLGSTWCPFDRPARMHLVTTANVYDNTRRLMNEHGGSVVENVAPDTEWWRLQDLAFDLLS